MDVTSCHVMSCHVLRGKSVIILGQMVPLITYKLHQILKLLKLSKKTEISLTLSTLLRRHQMLGSDEGGFRDWRIGILDTTGVDMRLSFLTRHINSVLAPAI